MKNNNSIMYNIYNENNRIGKDNMWVCKIKNLINSLGFSNLIDNIEADFNYASLFKVRLRDQFIQEWNASIRDTTKLQYYCNFKKSFCFEEYLDKISNCRLRNQLTCFRLSSHSLEIERGRYTGVIRAERLCKLCNSHCIESEYHMLMCCPKYHDLRIQYLGRLSFPTVYKFYSLMSTRSKKKLINIALFLTKAMVARENALDNITVSD